MMLSRVLMAQALRVGIWGLWCLSPYFVQAQTARERVDWVVRSTVGPPSLIGGLFGAGWGTLFNVPEEYGPHWNGFGKRYAMRFSGVAASNSMEASLGAIWGEDPRYFRAAGQPFKRRLWHVIQSTFETEEGRPAYARLIAMPGSNFLSNTWRADSDATAQRAVERTLSGFLGRMAGNAFNEFAPELSWIKRRVWRRKQASSQPGSW